MTKARKQSLLLALLMCSTTFATSNDVPVEISSGPKKVVLLELFTSEGCSSCPPADRWLSKLKADPGLWKEFAPIAFHVDYWDYIGWSDSFAQAKFSARQRRYAVEGGAPFVYTPGVFVNGHAWQGWRKSDVIAGDRKQVGNLSVRVSGENIAAHFDARHFNYEELTLHVAVLGMNLETQVGAGENIGKTLRHDFVALGVVSVPLDKAGSSYAAMTPLPATTSGPIARAIVAWVSSNKKQTPIQSVGGFL